MKTLCYESTKSLGVMQQTNVAPVTEDYLSGSRRNLDATVNVRVMLFEFGDLVIKLHLDFFLDKHIFKFIVKIIIRRQGIKWSFSLFRMHMHYDASEVLVSYVVFVCEALIRISSVYHEICNHQVMPIVKGICIIVSYWYDLMDYKMSHLYVCM